MSKSFVIFNFKNRILTHYKINLNIIIVADLTT